MPMITIAQLQKLAPTGKPNIIAAVADQADRVFAKYRLTTLPRVQIFTGLALEETGGFRSIEEDLQHYTATRIHQVWPSRFPTAASAVRYANNAQALANAVYGGRMGNTAPGDGYKFRGRGLIQVTGHDNYALLAKQTGLDLVNNPDLALADETLLECSVALFVRYPGILAACDARNYAHVWTMVGGGAINTPAHQDALNRTMAVIRSMGPTTATPPQPVAQPVTAHTPDPATAPPKVASVAALQSALNVLGASPKLDADGDLGDLTKQALYDLVNGLLDAKAPAAPVG